MTFCGGGTGVVYGGVGVTFSSLVVGSEVRRMLWWGLVTLKGINMLNGRWAIVALNRCVPPAHHRSRRWHRPQLLTLKTQLEKGKRSASPVSMPVHPLDWLGGSLHQPNTCRCLSAGWLCHLLSGRFWKPSIPTMPLPPL